MFKLLGKLLKPLQALLFFTACLLLVSCSKPSSSELKKANAFIAAIEIHIQRTGSAPSNEDAWKMMKTFGLEADESCQPCYFKRDDGYLVYFGMSLGESYTYHPDTKTWQ